MKTFDNIFFENNFLKEVYFERIYNNLLQEEILGNIAVVYHRSSTDDFQNIFKQKDLQFGRGAGSMYGKGLYTVYTLESTTNNNDAKKIYGNFIYKFKASIYNMFIFDFPVYQKVNPRSTVDTFIDEQIKKYRLCSVVNAQSLEEIKKICKNSYLADPINKLPFEHSTSNAALTLYDIIEKNFRKRYIGTVGGPCDGIIFKGAHDGQVAVFWNPYILIPIAKSRDNAKTWTKFSLEEFKKYLSDAQKLVGQYSKDHIYIENFKQLIDSINNKNNIDVPELYGFNLKINKKDNKNINILCIRKFDSKGAYYENLYFNLVTLDRNALKGKSYFNIDVFEGDCLISSDMKRNILPNKVIGNVLIKGDYSKNNTINDWSWLPRHITGNLIIGKDMKHIKSMNNFPKVEGKILLYEYNYLDFEALKMLLTYNGFSTVQKKYLRRSLNNKNKLFTMKQFFELKRMRESLTFEDIYKQCLR